MPTCSHAHHSGNSTTIAPCPSHALPLAYKTFPLGRCLSPTRHDAPMSLTVSLRSREPLPVCQHTSGHHRLPHALMLSRYRRKPKRHQIPRKIRHPRRRNQLQVLLIKHAPHRWAFGCSKRNPPKESLFLCIKASLQTSGPSPSRHKASLTGNTGQEPP